MKDSSLAPLLAQPLQLITQLFKRQHGGAKQAEDVAGVRGERSLGFVQLSQSLSSTAGFAPFCYFILAVAE